MLVPYKRWLLAKRNRRLRECITLVNAILDAEPMHWYSMDDLPLVGAETKAAVQAHVLAGSTDSASKPIRGRAVLYRVNTVDNVDNPHKEI